MAIWSTPTVFSMAYNRDEVIPVHSEGIADSKGIFSMHVKEDQMLTSTKNSTIFLNQITFVSIISYIWISVSLFFPLIYLFIFFLIPLQFLLVSHQLIFPLSESKIVTKVRKFEKHSGVVKCVRWGYNLILKDFQYN